MVSVTGRGKIWIGRPQAEPGDWNYSELNEKELREYNKLKQQE